MNSADFPEFFDLPFSPDTTGVTVEPNDIYDALSMTFQASERFPETGPSQYDQIDTSKLASLDSSSSDMVGILNDEAFVQRSTISAISKPSTSDSRSSEISSTQDLTENSIECSSTSQIENNGDNSNESNKSEISNEKPKKKSRKNKPPDPETLPPCTVCGEKASGLHYGANTCEPCKGFFRRSIVKIEKKKEEYKCVRDGNCKLGTGKRTMCSFCRYRKCLEVGMSHEAIKIGRYTYEKRTKDITEVKRLKNKEESPHNVMELIPSSVSTECTDLPDYNIENIVEKLIKIQEEGIFPNFRQLFAPNLDKVLAKQLSGFDRYQQQLEIFGSLGALPDSVYQEFLSTTGIELDNRGSIMKKTLRRLEQSIRNMVKFAQNIPGFSGLSPLDQRSLLKGGFTEFRFLGHHNRLNNNLKVLSLPDDNCMDGVHLSRLCVIMDQPLVELLFEYAETMQKCRITVEEATLLRAIVLTFSDRCELENPEMVDKVQWNIINNLKYILKKRHPNPEKRLWQLFDKFVLLRNVTEIGKKADKIRSKWPDIKHHPLVFEMINDIDYRPRSS